MKTLNSYQVYKHIMLSLSLMSHNYSYGDDFHLSRIIDIDGSEVRVIFDYDTKRDRVLNLCIMDSEKNTINLDNSDYFCGLIVGYMTANY